MKNEKNFNRIQYLTFAVSGFLILLSLWSMLTYSGLIPAFFLPPPTQVLFSIYTLFTNGSLLADIFASVYRILISLILSLLISLPLGITLAVSRKFEAFLEPIIAFIRYVPPSAFIPLAIIWFGIGDTEKILILFLGVAPYLTLLIADIVINTRRELLDTALTSGANRKHLITKVIIPNSMPGIWDSFRLMVGAAWTFVIIAEIVGASSGLGHLMIESQRFLRTDHIFAVIIIIGILGITTDYFFKITYKIFFPWTEKSHA